MYWVVFLILEGASQTVVQSSSLYQTTYTESLTDLDLEIKVSKLASSDSLLLLVSVLPITFSYSDGQWTISTTYYDLEGWAKSNSSELSLRISSSVLKAHNDWYIAVYKETSPRAEYTITYSNIIPSSCSSSCQGSCNGSDCACSEYSRGYNCGISLESFSLNQKSSISLQSYSWMFIWIPMEIDYQYLTIEAEKDRGTPFIFVDTAPNNENFAPSMFWHNFYMYFGDDEDEFTHSYTSNSYNYWAAGIYCNSSQNCKFELKATAKKTEDSESVVWIIVTVVVTMTILCLLIPISIKIVSRIRHRNQGNLQSATVLPLQMESIYPAKNWEHDSEKDNNTCAICLEDFNPEVRVRELSCAHVFHVDCIDSWAANRFSCPLCKRSMDSMIVQDLDN